MLLRRYRIERANEVLISLASLDEPGFIVRIWLFVETSKKKKKIATAQEHLLLNALASPKSRRCHNINALSAITKLKL